MQYMLHIYSFGTYICNMWESIAPDDKLAVQACDDFLDELLSHEVGGEGRVPDIR